MKNIKKELLKIGKIIPTIEKDVKDVFNKYFDGNGITSKACYIWTDVLSWMPTEDIKNIRFIVEDSEIQYEKNVEYEDIPIEYFEDYDKAYKEREQEFIQIESAKLDKKIKRMKALKEKEAKLLAEELEGQE